MSTNQSNPSFLSGAWQRLKSWEGMLLALLLVIIGINSLLAPGYLGIGNQVNLFILSIERVMVAITMTFLIINGEIDLSAPSIMGLAACVTAYLFAHGTNFGAALLIAMLICYRGLARVFLEDKSIGKFPQWFEALGQKNLIGPVPLALLLFLGLFALAIVILQYSGFGRTVYVIGNSKDVARYSGVRVPRVKFLLYIASGLMSALAGLLLAARLGSVRGDLALGFELDIITMVLLGGVSIFGGSGTLYGVFLSIMIILNIRNGMSLANLSGHFQTGVVGVLLILSVLGPNLLNDARAAMKHRRFRRSQIARST
jgi:rhamnose transport system permease protein